MAMPDIIAVMAGIMPDTIEGMADTMPDIILAITQVTAVIADIIAITTNPTLHGMADSSPGVD